MKVDFAFICDYADAIGKINALGIGFNTIQSPKAPFKHPLFCFVMQLRSNAAKAVTKKLEVHLTDANGNEIIPALEQDIRIARSITGIESIAKVALHFRNVQFPHYGSYSLNAILDENEIASIRLNITPPPKPLPGSKSPLSN